MKNSLKFKCNKDVVDPRDRKLPKALNTADIPSVDLRSQCAPIRNQLSLGCCTAFGVTELFDFIRRKHNLVNWLPSPLFTYYATRKYVNQQTVDEGASVRDALKSTIRDGVTREVVWPYIIDKFTEEPPQNVWEDAQKHQTLEYLYIDSTDKNAVLNCLNDGYPFVFGIRLYSSFQNSLDTIFGGRVHIPNRDTEKLLGGHCMMAVGYQKNPDNSEFIIVQNSWGPDWGSGGYCYIPMEYFMSNDTFDFWTIRSTEVCDTDTTDPIPVPEPTPIPEPIPTPDPIPVPEPVVPPTPTPIPVPVPIPEPEPIPVPVPTPAPDLVIPPLSMWKNPTTWALIGFGIVAILFILIK